MYSNARSRLLNSPSSTSLSASLSYIASRIGAIRVSYSSRSLDSTSARRFSTAVSTRFLIHPGSDFSRVSDGVFKRCGFRSQCSVVLQVLLKHQIDRIFFLPWGFLSLRVFMETRLRGFFTHSLGYLLVERL